MKNEMTTVLALLYGMMHTLRESDGSVIPCFILHFRVIFYFICSQINEMTLERQEKNGNVNGSSYGFSMMPFNLESKVLINIDWHLDLRLLQMMTSNFKILFVMLKKTVYNLLMIFFTYSSLASEGFEACQHRYFT